MRVLVVGAGAIGSLFGGLLARRHAVTLVGRKRHVDAVRSRGLRIDAGGVSETVRPEAVEGIPRGGAYDVVAISTKTYDLEEACRATAARQAEPPLLLCLQNGIGNEAIIARHFDRRTIVRAIVYQGASLGAPGRVIWFGRGHAILGHTSAGGDRTGTERLARALTDSGWPARVSEAIEEEIWKKLAVNAAINPLGAVTGLPNGALVRSPHLLDLLRAVEEEVGAVGRAVMGHAPETRGRAEAIARLTAENRNSMLVDLESGRRTEIDFLSGAVVRLARTHGVPAPVNEALLALVRGREEAAAETRAARSREREERP